MNRPRPPAPLLEIGAPELFAPAPELVAWIRSQYIADDGALYFDGHGHLEAASLGALWTNVENSRHQRRIVGQAELVENMGGRQGAWQRARTEFQLREWFGGELPDFVLTFDALYADGCEDVAFCALVDHEITHCAQALDDFGNPAFVKATGLPKFAMRAHSVEEFTSVVRRFGIEAAGEQAVEFVIAAASKPEIGRVSIATACGTCALRIAA